MDRYLPPEHPLSKIYRIGAAAFGAGLIVFGALGLARRIDFLSPQGVEVFGLSSNGLLSVISIIVGGVLIGAAVIGGPIASTTTAVIGCLFLLSGLVHLAVLHTPLNLLAFKIQNVVFSLVAGMLLLFVGLYGRASAHLPENNPYVRYRHHEDPNEDHIEVVIAEQRRMDEIDENYRAELAFAEGHPTPEQDRMVREDAERRAKRERRRAYEHAQQRRSRE